MPIPASISGLFRRWRRVFGVLAGLYGLWLLAGFFLIPWVFRGRLERFAGEALHRRVTLERIRFNPILLKARAQNLRIPNPDGSDWITLGELRAEYSLHRLFTHTIEFTALEMDRLTVRVSLDAHERLNFQDLLEQPAPAGPAKEAPSSWVFAIGRFQLQDGRVEFTDRSQDTPFRTVMGPVNLRVDGIRTEVGHRSGYAFEAWTEAREHLAWKGEFSLDPLASRGTVLVENLVLAKYRTYEQEQVTSEIRGGTASLKAEYRFAWGKGQRVVEVSDLGLSVRDLKVAEPGSPEPALDLPLVEVKGASADLLAGRAEVGSLHAEKGTVRVQRDKQGGLNFARLFQPPKPRPKQPDEKPFELHVRDLSLDGFSLGWEDLVPARPVKATLTEVGFHLQDLTLDPKATSKVGATCKLGSGTFQAEGTLGLLRAFGDLKLRAEGLPLAPIDPYLDGSLDLRIGAGSLGVDGRLRWDYEGRPTDGLSYQGAASVLGLDVRDAFRDESFLRWKALRLAGADLRTAPVSVAIQAVAWTDPEARLVVQPDGSSNVARALRLEEGGKGQPVTAAVVPPTPTSAPEVVIAKLEIQGGRLSFIDRSVRPNAALMLSEMEGSYLGLSTKPEATSRVAFQGRAGGLAPITITGHAMPLRHDLDTDLTLKIQGADLTDFTPYTGKYLGYTVEKGKLIVDSRLRIDHRNLKSANAVKLDQFYLGQKVESPDATSLPVKFGLACLRDSRGVIDINLPVEGSLDDPDVKYGKLVWKAIFGLLGEIVTSPFALIGNLFGSEAGDLSSLGFAPGGAALDAAATAKLQALAKALEARPSLRLEAEGAADEVQDGGALRRAGLEALLRRTRAAALKQPEEPAVPPAEREQWLAAAYEAAFPAPKAEKGAKPAPPPPPAEMEQRLLGTVSLEPGALDRLADARAKAVLAWLLDQGKADPERVFQVRTGQAKGALVAFSLK